ncbi:chromate efflux transporter [Azospirillum halopraeferens]|uniref:chromate efflux transporter n=1 Tax=Azospirillum halopraeferens TaxID=34010 RepID=UPI0004262B7E|nr:chromate efflux transporter [Azospirillum halopraeferens]
MTDHTLATHSPPADATPLPDMRESLRTWGWIALLSFGGPAGQIAVMHRILVEEKRWIDERRFLHALNYCMLLPGPEAQQLAVYIGWLLNRTAGGLMAGTLFVLPGFLSILVLSFIYALWGSGGWVAGLFFGLKAAVLAIVLQATIRVGRRALRTPAMLAVAGAAFAAIHLFDVPFPAIVAAAALAGFVAGRQGWVSGTVAGGHGGGRGSNHGRAAGERPAALGTDIPAHARPSRAWSLRIAGIFLVLWLTPVLMLLATLGPDDVFTRIAVFFSQAAVVTFGGAYAVLGYVAQEAVQAHGWLMPGEMLDGLAMAETTPGPLIQVVQFVGFMGALRDPGALHPLVAGTLAAVLTTWVTFVPCFLWVLAGAPWAEALRGHRAVSGALAMVTAAVVGVILNLAIWFALHTVFGAVDRIGYGPLSVDVPVWSSVDPAALALSAGAVPAVLWLRVGMIPLLAACAAAGVVLQVLRSGLG